MMCCINRMPYRTARNDTTLAQIHLRRAALHLSLSCGTITSRDNSCSSPSQPQMSLGRPGLRAGESVDPLVLDDVLRIDILGRVRAERWKAVAGHPNLRGSSSSEVRGPRVLSYPPHFRTSPGEQQVLEAEENREKPGTRNRGVGTSVRLPMRRAGLPPFASAPRAPSRYRLRHPWSRRRRGERGSPNESPRATRGLRTAGLSEAHPRSRRGRTRGRCDGVSRGPPGLRGARGGYEDEIHRRLYDNYLM